MHHAAFTSLEQEQLDWISRFADRLRLEEPRLAQEARGENVNEIARTLWEQPDWRALAPEAAAQRWLDERERSSKWGSATLLDPPRGAGPAGPDLGAL